YGRAALCVLKVSRTDGSTFLPRIADGIITSREDGKTGERPHLYVCPTFVANFRFFTFVTIAQRLAIFSFGDRCEAQFIFYFQYEILGIYLVYGSFHIGLNRHDEYVVAVVPKERIK